MTKADDDSAWRASIAALHAEAGGLLAMDIIRTCDTPDLFRAVAAGDPHAAWLARAMVDAVQRIGRAPRRRPMLCASCPRPLRLRNLFAVVVAHPLRSDKRHAISLGVCTRCATDTESIRYKAFEALKNGLWPELRRLDTAAIHPAGHA